MSVNGLFEKLSTKSSFKRLVFITDEGKCRRFTGIVFYLHEQFLNGLQSNPKLFAHDTSLFPTVQFFTKSADNLNKTAKISKVTI